MISIGGHGSEKIILKAKKFEFDGKSNTFNAIGGVKIDYNKVKIWAKRSQYEKDSKIVEVLGKVVVRQGKMTLFCRELKALLKQDIIKASGNIRLTFLDYEGSGDHIVFLLKENKAILEGNPKLVQGNDSLVADKIIMNLEKNTIETKGKTRIKVIPKKEDEVS